MTTRMLINATVANELRIAIVEDGELIELDIETNDQNQLKGNIYKGVVHNVEASLAACFVDIGGHKQGFLPFSEISEELYPKRFTEKGSDDPRITDVLKRGQEIVVQVAKDAIGEKGATLTTHLSIPGRFTVLLPGSDANGVSRKIEDDIARKKIRAIAAKIEKPEDCGFIVRTAGLGQSRAAIQKDLNNVIETHEKVKKAAQMARAPSLLYAEPDLIARTLRDFFSEEIDEVWIDTREEYEAARQYFEELMPDRVEKILFYQNPIPIFAYYHVEEQIEATMHRTVALPSGGSIVIDETEALVAIDVNSGKMTSERDHEDTVYKTNLEAAEEIARQLKLRDLGGIIVIDFIDMELRKNERLVEKSLAEAAKNDKARYKISKINAQGLCVLTRQRIRQGMRRAFQRRCQTCAGTGWLRTPESHSLSLLRRIETRLAQGGVGEVRVSTHRETCEYILNLKRAELMALERQYQCRVLVSAKPDMDRNADEVGFLSKGEVLAEITERLPPREERRLDRAAKRKARKKKRDQLLAGGHDEAPREESERERPSKRRRSRKDRREERRDEVAARAHPSAAEGRINGVEHPEANGAQVVRPRREELPPRSDSVGGTTFTGRPPPDVLARLKAERKARLNARAQRPVQGSLGLDGSSVQGNEPLLEHAEAATPHERGEAALEPVSPLAVIERVGSGEGDLQVEFLPVELDEPGFEAGERDASAEADPEVVDEAPGPTAPREPGRRAGEARHRDGGRRSKEARGRRGEPSPERRGPARTAAAEGDEVAPARERGRGEARARSEEGRRPRDGRRSRSEAPGPRETREGTGARPERIDVEAVKRELADLEELAANVGPHADIERAIAVRRRLLAEASAAELAAPTPSTEWVPTEEHHGAADDEASGEHAVRKSEGHADASIVLMAGADTAVETDEGQG